MLDGGALAGSWLLLVGSLLGVLLGVAEGAGGVGTGVLPELLGDAGGEAGGSQAAQASGSRNRGRIDRMSFLFETGVGAARGDTSGWVTCRRARGRSDLLATPSSGRSAKHAQRAGWTTGRRP